jgi:hypothetical protein
VANYIINDQAASKAVEATIIGTREGRAGQLDPAVLMHMAAWRQLVIERLPANAEGTHGA